MMGSRRGGGGGKTGCGEWPGAEPAGRERKPVSITAWEWVKAVADREMVVHLEYCDNAIASEEDELYIS